MSRYLERYPGNLQTILRLGGLGSCRIWGLIYREGFGVGGLGYCRFWGLAVLGWWGGGGGGGACLLLGLGA